MAGWFRKRRTGEDVTQSSIDQARPSGTIEEGTRTNQLVDELLAIATDRGFLSVEGKPRTREIGIELHQMNGMQRMLDVHR